MKRSDPLPVTRSEPFGPFVPHGTSGSDDQPLPPMPASRPAGLPAAAQSLEGEILQSPNPAQPYSRKGVPNLMERRSAHNKGKGYISKRLRSAIERLAQGTTITLAAQLSGMHRNSLSQAMQRPQCIELLEQVIRSGMTMTAAKAARRIDYLVDGARSEYVQLEASRTALGYVAPTSVHLGGDVVIEIKL